MIYPCGIHFLISQLVANAALMVILYSLNGTMEDFTAQTVFLTGLTGLITMVPCLWFYKRDHRARVIGGLIPEGKGRRLGISSGVMLLVLGAAMSTYANLFVSVFQDLLHAQEYQDTMNQIMEGKNYLMLIFWMGIVAPLAEEIVFRWLVYLRLRDYMRVAAAALISGVIFGVYHMNLVQAVYAGILGVVFACFMEITGSLWSTVLLHMGANIWSLILPELLLGLPLPMEYLGIAVLMIYGALLAVLIAGWDFFRKRAARRRYI